MASKKLREMILQNQKLNHIDIKMFRIESKSVEKDTEKKNNINNKSKKSNKVKKMKKNNNNSTVCMAIAAGKQTVENTNTFKYYEGIAPIGCKYVNPTKEQLSNLLGKEWTKDMEYVKTNEQGVQQINLMFPMEVEKDDVHFIVFQTIALFNAPRKNQDGTKIQVVDKWGNFAWVTNEEFNEHKTPMSKNGNPLKVDASDWRVAYQGEENLMKFLKPRLNISDAFTYNNGNWTLKSKEVLAECECRLDNIANYFKGDVSEIQNALNVMPENKAKGFIYVDEYEGKMRQAILREFVNFSSNKYKDIENAINTLNDNKGTNYTLCELREHVINSTNFDNTSNVTMPSEDNPFEQQTKSPWDM